MDSEEFQFFHDVVNSKAYIVVSAENHQLRSGHYYGRNIVRVCFRYSPALLYRPLYVVPSMKIIAQEPPSH